MKKQKLLSIDNNTAIITQEISTDIFNGNTPEFFVNMSLEQRKKLLELPSNSPELDAFILEERKKCKEGLNINGVFITGRLYYHLNYHKIALDKEDLNTKKIERIVMNPLLRDNEWIAFNAYEEAIHRKEGFVLGGARQLLKSEVQCSLSLYEINLFRNTEGLLLFTNSPDKQTYTKKAQVAIKYGEAFMQRPLIDNNWKNTEIRFGTTNKDNTTNVVGRLYIYNTDGDNASQIGAGKCLQHGSKVYYANREGVIEDCKVGDKIFGRDGKLTTILGVYPQGIVDLFKITFVDGRTVICCKEHLWTVSTNQYNFQTVDTNHLLTLIKVNDIYLPKVKYTKQLKNLAKKLNINVFKKHPEIKNIEKVNSDYATCISVDNEDKLFLTNDFIPTHNTITFFSYDEIAKKSMRESYEAVIPALISPYGLRCSPFLAFTGGNVENSRDAEEMFFHPEAARVMPFANEGKQTGFFMGGWYRQDFKKPQKFKDFLNKNGYNITTPSVLDSMEILVTDFDLANKVLDQEQLDAAKSKDPTGLIKHKMYFPRSIKEMFMKNSTSNFKKDAISQQREYLKSNLTVTYMETKRDLHTKVPELVLSNKKPITQYPKESYHDGDAPLCVYDLPKYKGFGVHVASCLPPDEKVMTNEGLKNIQDVTLNNKLISEEGNQVGIINLQQYLVENEDVYEIKVGNTFRTTKFTKEHPILISENKTGYTHDKKAQREGLTRRHKKFDFTYTPASQVKTKQWIRVPNIYSKEIEIDFEELWNETTCRNCNKLTNPLNKKDFWWLVGLMLGDGWVGKNKVSFAFNKKETYYIEKFKFVVKELFDKESISIKEQQGSIELFIHSTKLSYFFEKHFGKYAYGKKIPEWVKYLNIEFKHELLRGYLNSDGCVCIHKKSKNITTEFVSINLEMLEAFQDILFSLGIVSDLSLLRDEKIHTFGDRKCNTKKCYHIRIAHCSSVKFLNTILDEEDPKISKVILVDKTKIPSYHGCFISKNLKYIYFQITSIKKTKYSGLVYNFECDTHTFMCHHITTHNCDPYRENETSSSDSLGAFHVWRRNHNDLTDAFRDKMVLSYKGRPKTVREFHEMLLDVLEIYDAKLLYEHSDRALLDFFEGKNKTHLLIDAVPIQREINPKSKSSNTKGLRPTAQNKAVLYASALGLVNEEMEDGMLGYAKILDDVLLQELDAFDPDLNMDSYISFSLLAQARLFYDKFGVAVVTDTKKELFIPPKKQITITSAFGFNPKTIPKQKSAFGF